MIHKYKLNSLNIVIDVNSGAIHIVSDVVYDILDYYEIDKIPKKEEILEKLKNKYKESDISEGYCEINEIIKNNLLFTKDNYENMARHISNSKTENKNPIIKALCLLVAQDCNLRCTYCFAGEGAYYGNKSLMSAETGKKAIDFLIANSHNRKNLEVDFFGGEPLLNFDVIKEIVNYARIVEKENGKNIRFTITTNGILLDDEKLKYINEEMHNVVLSIDGRKEINDKMRQKAGGQGSYEAIVPIYKKTAESRNQKDYYVRGTFTRENLDFSQDVLHLADIGFKQISVEPVVGDKALPYTIKDEDLPEIFLEYERLANEIILRNKNDKFNFFHFMIDLEGGPCVSKRLIGCGAGTEYLAVTADGSLFPCHQFVGLTDWYMGNLNDGKINNEIRTKFENCNIYTKEKCRACFSKFYCSGGCLANAITENGDIYDPYEIGCQLQRKRVECAIMIKAKEI